MLGAQPPVEVVNAGFFLIKSKTSKKRIKPDKILHIPLGPQYLVRRGTLNNEHKRYWNMNSNLNCLKCKI